MEKTTKWTLCLFIERKREGEHRETEKQRRRQKSRSRRVMGKNWSVGLAQTKHMHTYKYQVNYVKERKGENVSS